MPMPARSTASSWSRPALEPAKPTTSDSRPPPNLAGDVRKILVVTFTDAAELRDRIHRILIARRLGDWSAKTNANQKTSSQV